ncbi:MAG TPA: NAD(P)-dependent alcohol dehydrogenase [Polyangiales bacterium]|nr:NAD(P)-dependent alcohol dehydrogenase [Polyangiales bacterium]
MNASAMPLPQVDSTSMRALLQAGYGSTDVLHLGQAVRPQPGPGEVLVRVHAAGLDRGTWHLMTGRPYLMRLMGFGFSAPKNPICGLDLAGTVVDVGEGVTRFRAGDAVFGIGRGAFAEYACAREDKLVRKPERLSFEEAAVLAVSGITALQALRDAGQLRAGERVLVIGASGGVGTYAVQLAKAYGATVTAVCSAAKVERVRSLGADHVIDYTRSDFANGSSQYDLVLDIGGNTPVARLRRALAPSGRLVFVGGENGGDWTFGFERQLYASMLGLFVKQRFASLMSREHWEHMQVVAQWTEEGKLTPLIDRRCSLSDVPAALRDLEAGKVCGKVVVRVA